MEEPDLEGGVKQKVFFQHKEHRPCTSIMVENPIEGGAK